MLESVVRQAIARHRMLAGGERVVVAVSGGVDSMVLLHVLAGLRAPLRLHLHAAHLDHGLRGAEGARDAAAAAAWAERLGIELTVARAGPLDRRGGSLQRAARAARYAFLEGLADRQGADRIAVGHTRDDLAETLLLNLVRGAGLRGLAGIPPVRGRIIRPLLEASREQIVAHATAHGVPWVEDASNRSDAYRRNRIRRDLIPLLATYNPRIREVLARAAGLLRAEEEFLDGLARDALRALARPRAAGEAALGGFGLARLDPVLRRRVLRGAAEALPGRPLLAFHHAAALEAWAAAGPRPGRCASLRRVTAWWEGEDLVLAPPVPVPPAGAVPLPLGIPTRAAPFAATFLASAAEWGAVGPPPAVAGEAWLDAATASDGLAVRAWRSGDRFRPLGLPGTKKLQDFFVDAKVPRAARARVPLVVSGDRILWVVGHRIDDRAKVTAGTRRVIHLTARPDPLADSPP